MGPSGNNTRLTIAGIAQAFIAIMVGLKSIGFAVDHVEFVSILIFTAIISAALIIADAKRPIFAPKEDSLAHPRFSAPRIMNVVPRSEDLSEIPEIANPQDPEDEND